MRNTASIDLIEAGIAYLTRVEIGDIRGAVGLEDWGAISEIVVIAWLAKGALVEIRHKIGAVGNILNDASVVGQEEAIRAVGAEWSRSGLVVLAVLDVGRCTSVVSKEKATDASLTDVGIWFVRGAVSDVLKRAAIDSVDIVA